METKECKFSYKLKRNKKKDFSKHKSKYVLYSARWIFLQSYKELKLKQIYKRTYSKSKQNINCNSKQQIKN
jgi:hypothetical protein